MVGLFVVTGASAIFLQHVLTFFQSMCSWLDGLWHRIKDFKPSEAARASNHNDEDGIELVNQRHEEV
jgi:hypothetical protein